MINFTRNNGPPHQDVHRGDIGDIEAENHWHDNQDDNFIVADEEQEEARNGDIKKEVATQLLSLRENFKLPAGAVGAVADEIRKCVEVAEKRITQHIIDVLQRGGIEIPDELLSQFQRNSALVEVCTDLNSQAKLETFVSRHMKFVAPEEKILGYSTKGNVQTLQYVPIGGTLQAMLHCDAVFTEVKNGHSSVDSVLRDVVDGQYFRNHPLFSMTKDAIGLIL